MFCLVCGSGNCNDLTSFLWFVHKNTSSKGYDHYCFSISYFFRNFGTLLIFFATAGLTGYFLNKFPATDDNILIADRFRSRVFGLKNFGIFANLLAQTFCMTNNVNLIVFGVFWSLAIRGHVIMPLMSNLAISV